MNSTPPTLDDVCEFIVDCLHKTAPTQESGFPLIRTPNIGKGRLLLDGVYRISQENYDIWTQRAEPEYQDLILAREAPAGNVAIVPEGEKVALGQRTVHLRPDKKKVDPTFLCYFLLAPKQQANLLAGETGATAKHVNMRDIRRLPLSHLPAIEDQKKLGSLIAAYDDLIENNRRRIQLLEESARLLYQEWFVHLRFPGHEQVRIIDGVPEGWDKTTADKVMDVLSGGTPKTKVTEFWDGEIPFFTPKDAKGLFTYNTEKTITDLGLSKCNSRLYPKYTVFITARGTVGKLSFAQRPMAMNQSCYALVTKGEISQEFLYSSLKASIEQFKARASGAVFDAIVVDTFKNIPFLVPSSSLRDEFTEQVKDVFSQIDNLSIQNMKLAQARDLLLPKLMSGELTV
ncbi:restriction endonuclease subunit S [Teredinibacter turnerae]|uniref:restriction endonuclease subunit S n=1 Tax=Teredinibacter turnerae TaxID=2426 RepID=UPI0030D4007A